ncbi:MAG: hypothetical protein M1812_004833 [Candelaria pacifica]|nr:MAG: hypothetical protein M1812_004833 [Candelaria pacifica]
MALRKFEDCELPASADFHVHLRDGATMEAVTPSIRQGGVNTVYVMPNLVPPITTVAQALAYRDTLQAIEPRVKYLMSLYLHPSITPNTIIDAKGAGITGVKSYPAGVTTHSSSGVVAYEPFFPVFAEMERQDLILNLHGETPSNPTTTILTAEETFLPTFLHLHKTFPKLRIILEHCSTAAAISAVKNCGPTVAATITPHHLCITIDDWAGDPYSFCKPVAKLPTDRTALLKAAVSGNSKFFLGTDSAPHPIEAKTGGSDRKGKIAAGVFTQPYATQLFLDALGKGCEDNILSEEEITKEILENFLSGFGRKFYEVEDEGNERIVLRRGDERIVDVFRSRSGDLEIVPFRRGEETWSVEWK